MKAWISLGELWPDYELHVEAESGRPEEFYEGCFNVPDALYEEYQKVRERFMTLRRQIRDIHIGDDPI